MVIETGSLNCWPSGPRRNDEPTVASGAWLVGVMVMSVSFSSAPAGTSTSTPSGVVTLPPFGPMIALADPVAGSSCDSGPPRTSGRKKHAVVENESARTVERAMGRRMDSPSLSKRSATRFVGVSVLPILHLWPDSQHGFS